MKRLLFFFLISIFSLGSFAQKMNGFGGELTILGMNANTRFWIDRTHGFEAFGGISSELNSSFEANDLSAGLRYLYTVQYRRTDRIYIGLVGKYKWLDFNDSYTQTNLIVPGMIVGREWYHKHSFLRGFALEMGYQYGKKTYEVTDSNGKNPRKISYTEFPLIVNIRYSFYQKK